MRMLNTIVLGASNIVSGTACLLLVWAILNAPPKISLFAILDQALHDTFTWWSVGMTKLTLAVWGATLLLHGVHKLWAFSRSL